MNPIGKDTVLSINKSTLLLLVLFCIPVNKIIKRQELKVITKNIFFTNKYGKSDTKGTNTKKVFIIKDKPIQIPKSRI